MRPSKTAEEAES